MKKLLLLIILIFSMTSTAFAFSNDPAGFRGLLWGSPVKALKNKYPNCQKHDDSYFTNSLFEIYDVSMKNDSISGIPIERPIQYAFWDNKLMEITVFLPNDYNTTNNTEKMLSALKTLYGEPDEKDNNDFMDSYYWYGPISEITFTVLRKKDGNAVVSVGMLSMQSEKVYDTYLKGIKDLQKNNAKQGW